MDLEKNKVKTIFSILAIVCVIIFSASMAPVTLQNDTFYTIKIGELIVNNGIDMQDHFSWHEDLAYTYPHWAYDTGIYSIYHLGEMTGIEDGGMVFIYISTILLTCLLGILLYVTITKVSKNRIIAFILTIGIMYLMQDFLAARAQLVTYSLFVLTILFIECFLDSGKKRYLVGIILISIAIANVHVAVWPFFFVLFLPYIAEYLIAAVLDKNIIEKMLLFQRKQEIKKVEKKLSKTQDKEKIKELKTNLKEAKEKLVKQEEKGKEVLAKTEKRRENPYRLRITKNSNAKWLILVIIICAFTGLLTPLGDVPYTYLAKTMQGNTMQSISEHQPLTLFNEADTMVALVMLIGILIFTDVKIKLSDFFMVGGLIFLSFMSRRQVSLLFIIGVIFFAKWLSYLFDKYDKDGSFKCMKAMITTLGKLLTIAIIVLLSIIMIKPKINAVYINKTKYPVDAATWMLENLDVNNIRLYNEYNYGSYLLYRGIPVFIDSRADLYAPEFNKRENEEKGRDIFSDYINISTISTYYETKFSDYKITHVIVINKSKLNMFLSRSDKYRELYKDDYFTIYERNVD